MNWKKNVGFFLFLIFLAGCMPRNPYRSSDITPEEIQFHINYLASDDLEGRFAGTEGARKAAAYIAREFRLYGLENPPAQNGYFQWFPFISDVFPGANNFMYLKDRQYLVEKDFFPLHFSSSDTAEGEVVFVGYGISMPEENYDDYKDVDLEGKIALILRYSPDGLKGNTPFSPKMDLRYKTTEARQHGAVAVLIVTGPLDSEKDILIPFGKDRSATDVGIPAVSITRKTANDILSPAGVSLDSLQRKINKERRGYSLAIPDHKVKLITDIQKKTSMTRNVLGYLPGTEKSEEVLIIGAHYDHLGWGGFTSVTPDTHAIHNGADDNASGTAALLELAQYFASMRDSLKRSILFTSFSAEELGLLGSGYYVKNPVIPLKNTIAMINMDMIGRMKDSTLIVGGAGTSPEWKPLLMELDKSAGLDLRFQEEGYGPSDHASFYGKEIPVLFLFTGVHEDYHKYSDDADKINSAGEAGIVRLVANLSEKLLNEEERPQFTRVEVERKPRMGRGPLNVYTGTIPDFAYQGKGYALQGVKAGGPAEKAGLKGGDVILEFGGVEVNNIYDYMYALQQYLPGDAVRLTVLRGDETIQKVITLGRKE